MAVTFRGTAKSHTIIGNGDTSQNLFVIENGFKSRVNVNITELHGSNDSTGAYTAVTPLIKVHRATSISGGQILEKVGFDTAQTSDSNIVCRAQLIEQARITATAGDALWAGFTTRQHTQVGQNYFRDSELLPMDIIDDSRFKLRPNEALVVKLAGAVAAANPAVSNNFFVTCSWEEDAIATFAISGTVTLNAVGVEGAKVIVIEADDTSMTNPLLVEVISTPAGGAWSSTIRTGKVGAAFVQYTSGGTLYTAPGSPYLQ